MACDALSPTSSDYPIRRPPGGALPVLGSLSLTAFIPLGRHHDYAGCQDPGYVAGTWDIDPVHPHIGFMAQHLMVSKVRRHFEKFQAQIVTAGDPLRSWANAAVEVNSGHRRQPDPRRSPALG